jgi:hypothetical protein
MQRERYGVVKDERDAYHELQDQFSAQLDMAFQQVETSGQEKDRVQTELVQIKKEMEDSEFFLKKMGALVGVCTVCTVCTVCFHKIHNWNSANWVLHSMIYTLCYAMLCMAWRGMAWRGIGFGRGRERGQGRHPGLRGGLGHGH